MHNQRLNHPNGNKEKRKKKNWEEPINNSKVEGELHYQSNNIDRSILNFAFFFPDRSRLWLLVRPLFFLNLYLRLPSSCDMQTDLELCCTESGALPWTVTPTTKWKGCGRWRGSGGSGGNLHIAEGNELFEREEKGSELRERERERERKFGNKKFLQCITSWRCRVTLLNMHNLIARCIKHQT